MNDFKIYVLSRLSLLFALPCLLFCMTTASAQREYTVVKPRERSATEKIIPRRKATQATKGVLAVELNPIIPGKVVITNAKGKQIEEITADANGRAEFELRRGQSYTVKASSP